MKVTFVVMAGGKGERLWPLAREATPKVCLSPNGGRSLLHATIHRLRPIAPRGDWLIMTTEGQETAVRAGVPRSLKRALIVEPAVRNTAACITLAAVTVASRAPDSVMVVAPADHWIEDEAAFQRAARTAIRAAVSHDAIATIGIRPAHPHPGLGYLCAGPRLDGFQDPRVFRLARFIEKPSRADARRLLRRPRTFWNSGFFVGTAEKFLEAITEWLPDHARRLVPSAADGGRRRALRSAYRALRPISFDRGVMAHVEDSLVVEGRFSWADLGGWETWAQLSRTSARSLQLDSENVTVVSSDRHLVAAIGVRDLLVVHTPSATLICRTGRTEEVRELARQVSRDRRLAAYR